MTGDLQLLIAVAPFAGLFLFCLHMAGKAAWRAHFRNRAYRRATGLDYEQVLDLVQALPVLEPIEPIKLTPDQWAVIKSQIEVIPTPPWHVPTVNPLFGTPIQIVATVEESTPHLQGWVGVPGQPTIADLAARRAQWLGVAPGLPALIVDEVNRLDGQVWPR